MSIFRRFRLWLSGQRRIDNGAVRGRIYEKKGPSGSMKAKSKGSVSISAVVTRADGRVEDLGEISRGKL